MCFRADKFLYFNIFHFKIFEKRRGSFKTPKLDNSTKFVLEKLSSLFNLNQETLKFVKKLTKKLYKYDKLL